MELIQKIKTINEVNFGEHTKVEQDRLTINENDIEHYLKEKIERLESISIEIVRSKDQKRIFRIFDVIEPRMKLNPLGADYPGIVSEIGRCGFGETLVLQNVAVVLIDRKKKDWKPIIEHTESYADISNYAGINLICLDIKSDNDSNEQLYYRDLYAAGLQLGIFLCSSNEPDNFDDQYVFNDEDNKKRQKRVGYFFQLCSAQYASSKTGPVFLGKTGDNFLPIAIPPTMVIDGAVTRGFYEQGFDTYNIQNNAVIYSLFGDKTIDLSGVVIASASMNNSQRSRNALIAANLFKNFLEVNAVIMTKAFGGASNLDLEKLAHELVVDDVLAVPIIQATSIEEKLSDALIFQTDIFRHLVCSGWTHEKVTLPADISTLFRPETINPDSELILEIEYIKGIIDNIGSTRIKVTEI